MAQFPHQVAEFLLVLYSRFQIVFAVLQGFFNRTMHGIPRFRSFCPSRRFPIRVNGLAVGRVPHWHPRTRFHPTRTCYHVAGFTHGSAHLNPFTTNSLPRTRRRIQREIISPCRVYRHMTHSGVCACEVQDETRLSLPTVSASEIHRLSLFIWYSPITAPL